MTQHSPRRHTAKRGRGERATGRCPRTGAATFTWEQVEPFAGFDRGPDSRERRAA